MGMLQSGALLSRCHRRALHRDEELAAGLHSARLGYDCDGAERAVRSVTEKGGIT